MNKSVFRGGLTFAASIASGSAAYASREDGGLVFAFVFVISVAMGLIASAGGD